MKETTKATTKEIAEKLKQIQDILDELYPYSSSLVVTYAKGKLIIKDEMMFELEDNRHSVIKRGFRYVRVD